MFSLLQRRYRELGGELQGVEVEQDVIYEQAFRNFGSQQIPKINLNLGENLSKNQQKVSVQRITKNLASESKHQSLIIFTDGSSLKNDSKASGWLGCGVVIYREGLNKVPICKKSLHQRKETTIQKYSGELWFISGFGLFR